MDPIRADRSHGGRFAVEFLNEEAGTWLRNPTWLRQRVEVVEDQETTPLARLAFAADFASGVGHPWHLPLHGINADITLNVIRLPESEWLYLDGQCWITAAGIGQVQATISDCSGTLAAVSVSRLVEAETDDPTELLLANKQPTSQVGRWILVTRQRRSGSGSVSARCSTTTYRPTGRDSEPSPKGRRPTAS